MVTGCIGHAIAERTQQDNEAEQGQADERCQTAALFASRCASRLVAFVHQRSVAKSGSSAIGRKQPPPRRAYAKFATHQRPF